jgi:hypothetical protein
VPGRLPPRPADRRILTTAGITITDIDVFYEKGAPKPMGADSLGTALSPWPLAARPGRAMSRMQMIERAGGRRSALECTFSPLPARAATSTTIRRSQGRSVDETGLPGESTRVAFVLEAMDRRAGGERTALRNRSGPAGGGSAHASMPRTGRLVIMTARSASVRP